MRVGLVTQQISESQLRAMLEFTTRENAAYFLQRLRQGIEVQSASTAGIRYCPDLAGNEVMFLDAATLLEQGVGSCGSIATYVAGALRALAQHRGVAAPLAAGRYGPVLVRRPNNQGVQYFHAIVRTPEGTYDPTRHLQQVCVTPIYA